MHVSVLEWEKVRATAKESKPATPLLSYRRAELLSHRCQCHTRALRDQDVNTVHKVWRINCLCKKSIAVKE